MRFSPDIQRSPESRRIAPSVRASRRLAGQRSDWIIVVAIFLLPLALFWPEVLGRRIFDNHDLWQYFYPYRQAVVDAARQHQWPLWNPYAFAGIPLSADGQTAVFFPPNWLAYFIAVPQAVSLAIVLNFSLAGLGMYGFCRTLRLGAGPAAIGAVAYGLNGFLAVRIGHQSIMAGAALAPWVFWALQRLLNGGGIVPLALAVAAQLLTGHPQIPAYTLVAAAIYVLCDAIRRRTANRLLPCTAAVTLGFALAAAQWIPWLELARFSPRAAGASFQFVTGDAMHGFDWLLFLFPNCFGTFNASPLNSAISDSAPFRFGERLGYVGILPLMLALWAIVRLIAPGKTKGNSVGPAFLNNQRSQSLRGASAGLLAIAVAMILIAAGGTLPTAHLIYLLPVLGKLRDMTRAVGVLSFCLCALASIGADELHGARASIPWSRPLLCAAAILIIMVGAIVVVPHVAAAQAAGAPMNAPIQMLGRALQLNQSNALIPFIIALASAGALALLARRPQARTFILALMLTGIDLGAIARNVQGSVSPSVWTLMPPAVRFLLQQPGNFRVVNLGAAGVSPTPQLDASRLRGSWCMHFGLDEINGYNSLQPRRNLDLVMSPSAEDISYSQLAHPERLNAGGPLAGLFNIRFALRPVESTAAAPIGWPAVYADNGLMIYQNPAPAPFVHFVNRITVETDPSAELSMVTAESFNPLTQATVDLGLDAQSAEALSRRADSNEIDTAQVAAQSLNTIDIQTRSAAPRLLVISQNWFPGWQATLDPGGSAARPIPVLRADYTFSAVALPSGNHRLRLRYAPGSVYVSLFISALSALLCVILSLLRTGQRKRLPVD